MKKKLLLMVVAIVWLTNVTSLCQTPGIYIGKNTAPGQTLQVAGTVRLDSLATSGNDVLAPTSTNDLPIYVKANGDFHAAPLGSNGQVWGISGGMLGWVTPSGGGITSLNGLTGGTQTFATGTSGTDFNISSTGTAHTFNFPTASATNRGLLSSTDWSTFNSKQSALTFSNGLTNTSGTVTLGGTLSGNTSIALGGNNLSITGSGNVGIGTSSPASTLTVSGSVAANYNVVTSTPYSVAGTDYYVVYNNGSTAGTFNLPAAVSGAGNFKGRIYVLKNTSTANLTVTPNGSETIDGAATSVVLPGNTLQLISTGATSGATWSTVTVPSTGQSTTTVAETGQLTGVGSGFALTLIPGLTTTITVPANCSAVVSTDGGLYTTSATANTYVGVEITVAVDGATPSTGGFRVIDAACNSITDIYYTWSISVAIPTLSAGSHTFAVYAGYFNGTAGKSATVGGYTGHDAGNQGELTVTILKN